MGCRRCGNVSSLCLGPGMLGVTDSAGHGRHGPVVTRKQASEQAPLPACLFVFVLFRDGISLYSIAALAVPELTV